MILLNGVKIKPTFFPDKTSQVYNLKYDTVNEENIINWKFENESEFIHLAQLVDLLKADWGGQIKLILDYFPYARQDKNISNISTFAVHTFIKLLNSLKIDEINILDIHNQDLLHMINNAKNVLPITDIAHAAKNADIICFPDQGALARYSKAISFTGKLYIRYEKNRNPFDGDISRIYLKDDEFYSPLIKDHKILIVDDICDGGATFIKIAKDLKERGAKEIYLFTTHGIYSKGPKVLFDAGIDKVYNSSGEVKNE